MLVMNTSKLMLTACISIVLFFAQLLLAADTDAKFQKILAVQKALLEGQDHFKKGNYQAAVFILEAQIASIDGNKEYLQLLQELTNNEEDLPKCCVLIKIPEKSGIIQMINPFAAQTSLKTFLKSFAKKNNKIAKFRKNSEEFADLKKLEPNQRILRCILLFSFDYISIH